jgi:hypothetical protein
LDGSSGETQDLTKTLDDLTKYEYLKM